MTRIGLPPATTLLAGGCLIATGAVILLPELRQHIGNDAQQPTLRLLTSPFVHGLAGSWAVPHLVGNLALLTLAGGRVERALGTRRFIALTVSALAAYGVLQIILDADVNGASVFVWAYAPPLARVRPRRPGAGPLLLIMWLIIPLAMTTVPYGFGWSGSPLGAFVVANTFHLSATFAGAIAAWAWRRRLRGLDPRGSALSTQTTQGV